MSRILSVTALSSLLLAPLAAQTTPAAVVPSGAGCLGLTLTGTAPLLAGSWDLTTTGYVPGSLVIQGLSLTTTTVLLPPPFGAPCFLHSEPAVLDVIVPVGPSANYSLAIPATATLKGLHVYAQSFAIGGIFASSNGLDGTIGI